MPDCLVFGPSEGVTGWQWAVEDLGDSWRCYARTDAEGAYQRLMAGDIRLCVLLGEDAQTLAQALRRRPPLSPPWLVTAGPAAPWADGGIAQAGDLPPLMAAWHRTGRLPRLAAVRHRQFLLLSQGLMLTLAVPPGLRAARFLPDMAALCAVYPPLTEDLRGRLYPLVARRHGMTPAAVERSLRLAIESTWSGASLDALERFFGHSVSPERGKPTNREFLCRVQERLLLAGQRIR